ncbi:MAG: hypothetical protein KGQ48_10500 [Bradyrhizobium sp.]|nr:hypothetical protein [Bradyrhizobium sp.]MDE2603509.1 hypothetical protein [Bradyrhizobium sp.]
MGHQPGYLAVGGKHRSNCARRTSGAFANARMLILGAVAMLAAFAFSTQSEAQSGPFNGLAGVWSGGGTVTLDDGSSERIRCRATYAVGESGHGLNQTLICASDSYKFDLRSNLIAEGGQISGNWSEMSRNISGTIQGRGGNGLIQVVASAPGFDASISVTTRGNRQSVAIRSEGALRSATIALSRS